MHDVEGSLPVQVEEIVSLKLKDFKIIPQKKEFILGFGAD